MDQQLPAETFRVDDEPGLRGEAAPRDGHADRARPVPREVIRERPNVEELRSLGWRGELGYVGSELGDRAQRRQPWPEPRRGTALVGPPPDGQRAALGGGGRELVGEPRLADARLTLDDHEPTLIRRFVEGGDDVRQLR